MAYTEGDLIAAMTSKGHTESTARGAIAGRGFADLAREYLGVQSGGGGGGSSDVLANAEAMLGFNRRANEPVVASLQQGIGEIGQTGAAVRERLEAGIQPMRDRYQQVLDSMVGNVGKETSNEFGRRGIPQSSGLFEQTMTNKVNPLIRDIGLASEEGTRAIMDRILQSSELETEQKRNVLNLIAELQAGNPSSAMSSAIQSAQLAQNEQLKMAELNAPTTQEVTANGRKYLVTYDSQGNIIRQTDLGASTTGSGDSNAWVREYLDAQNRNNNNGMA